MNKRCISLENIKELILFWAIVSVFMMLALFVVIAIDKGIPYTIVFSILAALLTGVTLYLAILFLTITKRIKNNEFRFVPGKVIDIKHGPYFGGLKLGIEFQDENGKTQKMQTEPYFWPQKAELYLRNDFVIGYWVSKSFTQVIIMDEVR
jgi:hypothetical protein